MDIRVYSRNAIESSKPHEDAWHVFISLTTPGDPEEARLPTCGRTLEVLRISVNDMDDRPEGLRPEEAAEWRKEISEARLFGQEEAERVVDLVLRERTHPIERVLVHCDAGLSRSPAVAAGVARIAGLDDSRFFQRWRPNMRVYREILLEGERRAGR